MTKLILIDGNAIMHRAFHALPPLTTSHGEPINAVYGFVSILTKIIQDLRPTHIAVAFDRPEPTFRKNEFEAYQSNRPEMDKVLSSQFEKIYETLEAFGIPVYSQAGFEADDVIGTIATKANLDEVIIITGDRDILQLVNNKVRVYLPTKGLSEGKIHSPEDVKEKLGVTPVQIIDYKALVGDASDNYPGVSGIGPKTAINLITKYDTLENIYNHIDETPESTKKKLLAGKEMGFLCKKLATIVTDMDINIDLDQAKKWRLDSDEVLSLFKEYGFRTLTKRVQDLGKLFQSENQMTLL